MMNAIELSEQIKKPEYDVIEGRSREKKSVISYESYHLCFLVSIFKRNSYANHLQD